MNIGMNWSKGPYKAVIASHAAPEIHDADGILIARTFGARGDANARLMAAAHEMQALLLEWCKWCSQVNRGRNNCETCETNKVLDKCIGFNKQEKKQ